MKLKQGSWGPSGCHQQSCRKWGIQGLCVIPLLWTQLDSLRKEIEKHKLIRSCSSASLYFYSSLLFFSMAFLTNSILKTLDRRHLCLKRKELRRPRAEYCTWIGQVEHLCRRAVPHGEADPELAEGALTQGQVLKGVSEPQKARTVPRGAAQRGVTVWEG